MLKNYIKVAIRNIGRNKLYAIINILGLSMGLTLFLFGVLLSNYEYSHDKFFKNSDRIYTLRAIFSSNADIGIKQSDGLRAAVAPIIKADLNELEGVARTIRREFLISVDENNYYEFARFADLDFMAMFDFNFIAGDRSAFMSSTNVIISESLANKYFGNESPIGKTITLDHEHDLTVGAVIHDLPANNHFNSLYIMKTPLDVIIPMNAMERITGFVPDENWSSLGMGNLTYVMLPPHLDQNWLQTQIDGIYERHYPELRKEMEAGISVHPLTDASTALWAALGIPLMDIVKILGLLILIVACVNYTNLATAQSLGRAREVGLRKTLGAGHGQLLFQFIVESMTITFFAMVLALTFLEIIIPMFNTATGKILSIDYVATLPWMIMTVVTVGTLSGAYPAYVITKTSPIEALRDTARKGRSATWIRAMMIGIQFTISVCILASVLVIYAQNDRVEQSSQIFPKDQIYTLDRLNAEQLTDRHEILRNEMLQIPYVEKFTLSSQVPYEQNNNNFKTATRISEIDTGFNINQLLIDDQFVETYDIPLVAGRTISKEIALDTQMQRRDDINVMVNELAAQKLGFESPESAIGQVFYEEEEEGITTYTIVGVLADRNILGLHNVVKPFLFFSRDASYRLASIKISKNAPASVVNDISDVWKKVYPDYPMQGKFLNETFQMVYSLFDLGTKALAAFALFAFFLALIGLFGLAAFMAEQKTKEIGIRKVLGASNKQIIQMLILQFSKPVIWATPIALLLAYLISSKYLEFFAERIGLPYGMLLGAGIVGLLLSWLTVATHAFNISKTNPVNALHHD